ncbi:MAG: type II toxin-antitoxin system HicA family toxin [Nitrospirae bacterium]|nr:type II toxin-antitoxin system HicA family toxin [Nitrospirota bacterium]MBI5696346.1 type II toxin-antitoxin system HicA family toxin [Nitrospirota bacterium]
MTPHLPAVTSRQVVRAVLKLGFVLDRQSGSHAIYFRESDRRRVVVPAHPGKTIKPKTLLSIIGDMGINVDEFRGMI